MSGEIHAFEIDGAGPTALRRTLSLLLPMFLLAAMLLMVSDRADASVAAGATVAAASASSSSASASAAQIDIGALIRAIVCPILGALASGPFGSFIGPIINRLRAAFGCPVPSG
ncbi:MAG: hypothetical protein QOE93_1603 [Actinomycetota bacterium]|jgi:hypothetical protein|nr:hypothetical protein [Actinomycetota bacterium]